MSPPLIVTECPGCGVSVRSMALAQGDTFTHECITGTRRWRLTGVAFVEEDVTADETVTVHLDRTVAQRILARRGWSRPVRGGWESPVGQHHWHIEEALGVALASMSAVTCQ